MSLCFFVLYQVGASPLVTVSVLATITLSRDALMAGAGQPTEEEKAATVAGLR